MSPPLWLLLFLILSVIAAIAMGIWRAAIMKEGSAKPKQGLSWQVEDAGSETVLTLTNVLGRQGYELSTRVRADTATCTLVVDGVTVPLSSVKTVWLRGSYFEVYGWLDWKVGLTAIGLGDIVVAGGNTNENVLELASTLARMVDVQLVDETKQVWGTW